MPIEIKELVIRTVLESGGTTSTGTMPAKENDPKETAEPENKSSVNIEREIKKQLKKYRANIINQCIEAVNDGLKRQNER